MLGNQRHHNGAVTEAVLPCAAPHAILGLYIVLGSSTGRRRRFLGEHVLDRDQVFRPKGHLLVDGLLAAPVWMGSWPILSTVNGISALLSGLEGIPALLLVDGLLSSPVVGWAPCRSDGWAPEVVESWRRFQTALDLSYRADSLARLL